MSDKKRFKSMKTKIMFSTIIPVVVSFALICTVIFISLFESLRKTARAEFLQISQKYAHDFETKLNDAVNYLSILSDELAIRASDDNTDRSALKEIVFEIFDSYGLLDGSSVYFEPNAYDGLDNYYIGTDYGTDTSGRICWYFYVEDGQTKYLKEAQQDEEEFGMPHYVDARDQNKPIYGNPFSCEVDGVNIYMFTLTFPINDAGGNFIGAVTVDLFLDDIYADLLNEKIYKTGYVLISNDNEIIIYSPNYDDIGKTRADVGINYPLPPEGERSIFFNSKSIVNGKSTMVTIESVYIPQLSSYFYVSVTAPLSEINAGGIKLIVILITISVLVVAAIALLIFFLIGKLSAPLYQITESVNKIAEGNYNVRISGTYKGEFGLVKNSVNKLADSIEEYIKESQDSLDILKNILNGLNAVIYVSDPVTDEILFINDSMKKLFGLDDDVAGRICWKVFQDNFDKRCDFCPCYKLDKDSSKPIEWEEHNTVTKRHYRNVDTYINWIGGKKVHLQHSIDITDSKKLQLKLDRRLKQQSLMSAISQSFLSGTNLETLMKNTLRMTGEFLDVAQVLFYKLETDGITLNCESEWISPNYNLESRIGGKLLLEDPILSYLSSVRDDKNVCMSSNDPQMKKMMASYRVSFQNYMTVPVFLKDSLYGALDISMEDKGLEWSESDMHLAIHVASLVSGVLERYNMESELIVAKELAEQGSRSKSEFLSRMSHEIRTPMNAIIGMTKIADGTDDIQKLRYCLSTINSSSVHLLGIINDILDMSKIEAGKFELDYEYFNIEKMLMKICNLVIDKTEQKNQALNINIGKKMHLSYLGDELRLSQVITNLLSNAVKFTPENGIITLSVDEFDTENDLITVRFKVSDTGIGMTDEQMTRLFTSFEQADGSISRKFGGTGLGLAISKSIVKKMGGDIWVESHIGHGSTFIFDVKMQCTSNYKAGIIFDGITASDIRVLVVDDSLAVREQFVDILDKFQIACDVSDSGDTAISLIEKTNLNNKSYDVIFLDSEMPDADGVQTVKKLKDKIDKNTIIVMMTFSQDEDCKMSFKQLGINRFMTKLLFPSTILNCINEVIGKTVKDLDIKTSPAKEVVDFSGLSILLVDDVEINREIFISLMEDTQMIIDVAENGIEAVQKYKDNPDKYDMIIMDIQMPEMDGYEATRIIRALNLPTAKTIPIIAMTANAFSEDIKKCLESGMNDHIAKPIDVDNVTEKIMLYNKK